MANNLPIQFKNDINQTIRVDGSKTVASGNITVVLPAASLPGNQTFWEVTSLVVSNDQAGNLSFTSNSGNTSGSMYLPGTTNLLSLQSNPSSLSEQQGSLTGALPVVGMPGQDLTIILQATTNGSVMVTALANPNHSFTLGNEVPLNG